MKGIEGIKRINYSRQKLQISILLIPCISFIPVNSSLQLGNF